MSIDARVDFVEFYEDGGGKLHLIDRPPRRQGDTPGVAGQSALCYDSGPYEDTALNGCDIWGNDSVIMLGDRKIATRVGYTKIRFVDGEEFKKAVAEYHRQRRVA